MKKIRYINLLAIAGLLFVAFACDQADGRQIFEGPYYVQLTSASSSISEADTTTTVSIQISNVGPTLTSDIIVTYSTEGSTAVEGVDYELAAGQTSGQIVIPAGEHFATLDLNTINNSVADGVKTLDITLVSADNGLSAGSGAIGVNHSLTISDDDCPLDLTTFPGSYDLDFTHTVGFLWASGTQTGFVATLTATSDPNIFNCENFFGIVDREAAATLGSADGLGLIPLFVDDVAETVGVSTDYSVPAGGIGGTGGTGTGHWFYDGGAGPREIRAVSSGPVATCGPDFSLAADIYRTNEGTLGTSITEMNFKKIND